MKPLIGITAGEIQNRLYPWGPIVYGQSHTYVDAVIRAGGLPVVLPITDNLSVLGSISSKLDGLLLSGGNDLNPALYGEDPYPTTVDFSDKRDSTEIYLLQEALVNNKPILGICRGMQILNVACGGSLHQHIQRDISNAVNHNSSLDAKDYNHLVHEIRFEVDSKVFEYLDTQSIIANSLHHQTVKELGKGLVAVGWSKDGLIEAIEMTNEPFVVGIQAHPETLESHTEPEWQKLFSAFIAAAKTITRHSDELEKSAA